MRSCILLAIFCIRRRMSKWPVFLGILLSLLLSLSDAHAALLAGIPAALQQALGNGTLLVEDERGRTIYSHRAQEHFVPASILKIATSACALHLLPKGFRFETSVYVGPGQDIYIQGSGDPALTSEELARFAQALKAHGLRTVGKIILDDRFFASDIQIDGQSRSLNPYDALNSALLVNYNTANVRKLANGQVVSAEPQTPTTPSLAYFAKGLRAGTYRINLSKDPVRARHYVGELIQAFLTNAGVAVTGPIVAGPVPQGLKPFYVHQSAKSLEDNVRDLLEFSNNLTANQLFLFLGAAIHRPPATTDKGAQVLTKCLHDHVGWRDFRVIEGSGLSRENRVSAAQMMQLLRYFEPYRALLPRKDIFLAKTGTLNNVSTLAGYMAPAGKLVRFVLMQNGPHASYESKFRVGKLLYRSLGGE